MKKSFPFPKLSLQRRRRLMALGSSRERMLRKHKKREKGEGKTQGVREARYRKARKLLKNAIAKVDVTSHKCKSVRNKVYAYLHCFEL